MSSLVLLGYFFVTATLILEGISTPFIPTLKTKNLEDDDFNTAMQSEINNNAPFDSKIEERVHNETLGQSSSDTTPKFTVPDSVNDAEETATGTRQKRYTHRRHSLGRHRRKRGHKHRHHRKHDDYGYYYW